MLPITAGRQEDFAALDRCLEAYKQTLTPLAGPAETMAGTHALLVAYTLTQCATIQLHVRFVSQSATSRSRCLTAANGAVRALMALPTRNLKYVNPIMAVSQCHVPFRRESQSHSTSYLGSLEDHKRCHSWQFGIHEKHEIILGVRCCSSR